VNSFGRPPSHSCPPSTRLAPLHLFTGRACACLPGRFRVYSLCAVSTRVSLVRPVVMRLVRNLTGALARSRPLKVLWSDRRPRSSAILRSWPSTLRSGNTPPTGHSIQIVHSRNRRDRAGAGTTDQKRKASPVGSEGDRGAGAVRSVSRLPASSSRTRPDLPEASQRTGYRARIGLGRVNVVARYRLRRQ